MDKIDQAKHKLFLKRKRQVLKHSSRDKRKEKQATRARKAKMQAVTERCIELLKERREIKRHENKKRN